MLALGLSFQKKMRHLISSFFLSSLVLKKYSVGICIVSVSCLSVPFVITHLLVVAVSGFSNELDSVRENHLLIHKFLFVNVYYISNDIVLKHAHQRKTLNIVCFFPNFSNFSLLFVSIFFSFLPFLFRQLVNVFVWILFGVCYSINDYDPACL